MRREAQTAAAVHAGAGYLAARSRRRWPRRRPSEPQAEAARTDAEAGLGRRARPRVRTLTADFESLVDAAHRDEMARAEQRMRVDTLIEKAMAELGLEPEVLIADYGPDQLVPVLTREDGSAGHRGRRASGADPVRARAAAEAAADRRTGPRRCWAG